MYLYLYLTYIVGVPYPVLTADVLRPFCCIYCQLQKLQYYSCKSHKTHNNYMYTVHSRALAQQ